MMHEIDMRGNARRSVQTHHTTQGLLIPKDPVVLCVHSPSSVTGEIYADIPWGGTRACPGGKCTGFTSLFIALNERESWED